MIRRFDIEERVREWGLGEAVVEKDHALAWLLWAIGADPVLGERWVFKGGTCLKKCFVETWRFSEDLDFTVLPAGPVAPEVVLPLLRAVLERAKETSGVDFLVRNPRGRPRAGGESAEVDVYYRGPRQTPGVARIKLDLSRLEKVVLPPVRRTIHHAYPDTLPEPGTVLCYAFEEVFAEKIRAMAQRGRPRDLYDIVNLYRRTELWHTGSRVREVLAQKCEHKGMAVPTLASLEAATDQAEMAAAWEHMLGHQLPSLPPLESFRVELPGLFEWLEGAAEPVALTPLPAHEAEDPDWKPAPFLQVWRVSAPLEAIRFAAANRLCVELLYNGEWRVIEPYSLRRSRVGHLLLHAIRTRDREHRTYRVDRIQGARITEQVFQPVYAVELSAVGPLAVPPTPGSRPMPE